MPLERSRFHLVLSGRTPHERGLGWLSYVEEQIRHESWQDFHDDVLALPTIARRLYLPLCFDIGVSGDGMDQAFSFYGYSGDSLIREIVEGFRLLESGEVADLVEKAWDYWRNPASPMHSEQVAWLRMDADLGDIHGRYFRAADDLFSKVGLLIEELGEQRIHA